MQFGKNVLIWLFLLFGLMAVYGYVQDGVQDQATEKLAFSEFWVLWNAVMLRMLPFRVM